MARRFKAKDQIRDFIAKELIGIEHHNKYTINLFLFLFFAH